MMNILYFSLTHTHTHISPLSPCYISSVCPSVCVCVCVCVREKYNMFIIFEFYVSILCAHRCRGETALWKWSLLLLTTFVAKTNRLLQWSCARLHVGWKTHTQIRDFLQANTNPLWRPYYCCLIYRQIMSAVPSLGVPCYTLRNCAACPHTTILIVSTATHSLLQSELSSTIHSLLQSILSPAIPDAVHTISCHTVSTAIYTGSCCQQSHAVQSTLSPAI